MGWLDWFTGGEDGQLDRHAKRVKNLNAQAEDRQASAHWLANNGTEKAIYGLLGRFSVTYEHQMKDAAEKDLVMDLLRELGADKLDAPIRAWVRKNDQFARPLALLLELSGSSAVVDLLLEMLGREVDPFKPEKKRQILIKLADHKDSRISARVAACLEDFDEGIRYAAAEALLAQNEPSVQDDLAKALANRQEESNRLRVRIAAAFAERGWELGAHSPAVAERPPVGWRVVDRKLVAAPV